MTTLNEITNAMVTSAGHDAEDVARVRALCAFLDCAPDDLKRESYAHYGLPLYSTGKREFAIGTDAEADAAAAVNIKDSIWAFNASFILEQCGLPLDLEECIKTYQEKKCESANDSLLALVEKCAATRSGAGDGLKEFTAAAVSADGRGHFLSGYDGNENEQVGFYIYRVN